MMLASMDIFPAIRKECATESEGKNIDSASIDLVLAFVVSYITSVQFCFIGQNIQDFLLILK